MKYDGISNCGSKKKFICEVTGQMTLVDRNVLKKDVNCMACGGKGGKCKKG